MVNIIMDSINNHFIVNHKKVQTCFHNEYVPFVNSKSSSDFFVGQYILIKNSILNDGLYKIVDIDQGGLMLNEKLKAWCGEISIYALAIPKDFLSLVTEIENWQKQRLNTIGVVSEKIGEYGISFDKDNNTWQKAFADRLATYRKVYSDLR